jgi:hypothetical protein
MAGKAVSLLTHGGDKALPLSLGRATPKTAQEIDRHATRVARQMLGEHVTSGKPKDTANLAGRSFRESERLKGLDYRVEPTGAARESTVYTPRKGDVNVAIPGDQTISDAILRSVGDIEGIDSVQEGGAKYGLGKMDLEDPLFWASSEVPAQLAQNKINRVAGFYDPQRVVGQHLAMGNVANNFAMHLADANMRAIRQSKVKPKNLNLLDEIIASGYEKKNKKTGQVDSITFPNWPGMANPEEAMLAMRDDPKLRKWFNDRMKVVDDVTKPLGLPSGLDIQWAVTEPKLRNMEINLTGLSAGEMVPNAKLTDTADHNTYDKGIRGLALGHQGVLTPFQMSFPDAAEHIASTQRPQDFTGTIQKVFPHQIVDDQWLDEISKYRELIKKYTGQKKGGAVRKGGGGFMAKELAKRLAPKVLPIVEREANLVNKALTKTPKVSLPPENSAPAVNRLDMNYKDVTKRVPELTEAAKMVARGEMTAGQYDLLVRKLKPVTPYNFVPQPATAEDAMRALNESKRSMFGKTSEMTAGEQADLRLDIPAYKDHGVWVNSIHRKDQPTVYGSTSSVKNATMIGSPDKALKVAQGGPKAPFAVIRGEWNPMDEAMAVKNAQDYLNNPDWKQVGYDPERHGFFYDRSTMAPVIGADEVIQIGPLVLAKKPKYGNPDDFPFKKGGSVKKGKKVKQQVSLDAMRLAVLNKQSKDKRYG